MRILATSFEINTELIRLIKGCSLCQIAVAWASVDFIAFELLSTNASKIERMVVGTHFYQTHPQFIESFLANDKVRFVLNPDGIFHPKVYLFEKASGQWECIVGSPNFTHHGVSLNDEMAVLITNSDHGASDALEGIKTSINNYWHKAGPLTQHEFEAYKDAWNRKRLTLKNLQGKFGNPKKEEDDDNGKNPLTVPILTMTWADYFAEVKSEEKKSPSHSMEGRLKVIQVARELFEKHPHFSDISLEGRQKIAGLIESSTDDSVNYRWFGSMIGAGKFFQAINNNNEHLSLALDLIPLTSAITRDMFLNYITEYKKAFPVGRHGIATASRLLAMKRPDLFVCFDAQNKKGLCGGFGISQRIGYEEYWDSIIARIMDANWWCSPPPTSGIQRSVWEARAAFLDSLYYQHKTNKG